VLFAFVVLLVLGLVSSVLATKPRDWEEDRLRNDLFYVEWDVKPQLSPSAVGRSFASQLCTLYSVHAVYISLANFRLITDSAGV